MQVERQIAEVKAQDGGRGTAGPRGRISRFVRLQSWFSLTESASPVPITERPFDSASLLSGRHSMSSAQSADGVLGSSHPCPSVFIRG
jgi:hypothetical protein